MTVGFLTEHRVVLSQMQVTDEDVVRQALDTLDADVYLVALGNHAGFADSRFDAVIEIELARRGDVADALVTVINHARTAKDTP